jgi:competence protein ComEC
MTLERAKAAPLVESSIPRCAATPLLPWAIGMMMGIVLDSRVPIPPTWCLLTLLACGLTTLSQPIRNRTPLLLVLVAAASVGAIRHHLAFRTLPVTDVAHLVSNERQLTKITGTIVTPPRITRTGYSPFEPWLHTTDRTSFVLSADSIEGGSGRQSVTGQVRVSISEPVLIFQDGERIEASGWLSKISPPRNPGQYDWALHNARRGIRVRLQCNGDENVSTIQSVATQTPSLAKRFRHLLLRGIDTSDAGTGDADTGDASSSLLDTMVLGHRTAIDEKTERLFLETGCAHYLAVSGIHIAMLASIVWFPARLFGASRRSAAVLLIIAVIVYVAVADARPSMLRAAVIACTLSVAMLLRRRANTINSLSVAALLLLSINPLSLFDVGFQLSFVAVTGIVLLTPVMSKLSGGLFARQSVIADANNSPQDPSELIVAQGGGLHWLKHALHPVMLLVLVSIAAWVSTLPIVSVHFGRLAPLGWLGSILSFPMVFVVMILSFLKLAVGLIIPVASPIVDSPLRFSTEALQGFLEFARTHLGGPIDVTPPSATTLLAYYGCLLAIVVAVRRGWSVRRGLCAAFLFALTIVSWNWPSQVANSLTITQFAVGRGTTTFIELSSGGAWIYDAGSSSPSDPGEHLILPYMRERKISHLDGIIVSHPNLDHFGGVPAIVRSKPCDVVYVNTNGPHPNRGPEGPFEVLLQELKRTGQTIRSLHAGDTLDWGGSVRANILWPPAQSDAQLSVNDQSIVIRLEYQNRSVLLSGDIGYATQQFLIDKSDLKSDVLILPHHGAVEENTAAFIKAVNPTTLVRSSFVKNEDSPGLERAAGSIPIVNTANGGAIQIMIRDGTINVAPLLNPPQ